MCSVRVNSRAATASRRRSRGFTLVEIIVGLVLSTVAISLVATLILPLFERSTGPVFQIRAAELAQSILDDAMSRRYDEASPVGGTPPCTVATCSATLGADAGEVNRGDFDDVDDFNAFCGSSNDVQDVFGNDLSALFNGYSFEVCVAYDGNYNGTLNEAGEIDAKVITVTVTPPIQASIVSISAYRGNY